MYMGYYGDTIKFCRAFMNSGSFHVILKQPMGVTDFETDWLRGQEGLYVKILYST